MDENLFAALKVQESVLVVLTTTLADALALIASGGFKTRSPRTLGRGNPSGKSCPAFLACKYCGKTTHLLEKCWKEFGKP